jgi:hypothetical protein
LTNIDHLQYKAEEMHKQEIIDAYANGHNDVCRYMNNDKQEFEHGESFFAETYGSKGSDTLKDYHIVDINEMVHQVPDDRKMVDDEIKELKITLEKAAKKYCLIHNIPIDQMIVKNDRSCEFETPITMFIKGAKWYREQLKQL